MSCRATRIARPSPRRRRRGIPEGEEAVSADFRIADLHETVGDGEIAVLDDDAAGGGAPERIEAAQILAAERAFDPRPPERARHDAVELPRPPNATAWAGEWKS